MPEYLAPGVYVEEIDLGSRPIEGVSTSTTGFVGMARRGPVNLPVFVDGFGAFQRVFGGLLPEAGYGERRWLPYAVDGYFANGGKRAYIVRVARTAPTPGDDSVATVAATVLPDRRDGRRSLLATARAGETLVDLGHWGGLEAGAVLRLGDGDNAETVRISGFEDRIRVAPALQRDHPAGTAVTVMALAGAAATTLSTASAIGATSLTLAAIGGLAAGDAVLVSAGAGAEIVTLTSDPVAAGPAFTVNIAPPATASHAAGVNVTRVNQPAATTATNAAAADGDTTISLAARAGLLNGSVLELLDGAETEYVQLAAAPSGAGAGTITLRSPLRNRHRTGTPARLLVGALQITAGPADPDPAVYPEVGAWGNEINIRVDASVIMRAEIRATAAVGDPALTLATVQGIEAGTILRLPGNRYAVVSRVQGNRVFLEDGVPAEVTADDLATIGTDVWRKQVVTRELTLSVSYAGQDEVFPNLSMDPRHGRYIERIVNAASRLVHVRDLRAGAPADNPEQALPLITRDWHPAGGDDAIAGTGVAAYIGRDADDADRRQGFFALLNRDDISLVTVPGRADPDIQLALIAHAERARYRFAILDPAPNASLERIQEQRSLLDSRYAALYYPQVQIFDPLENRLVYAPPSGHVAGLFARTDAEVGVHKAPANAVLSLVRALEATVTQGQHEVLNPRGINAIRAFPGRGIRVFGARTISSDPAWKYVNVRRLFIFLEHSIDNATQFAVFQPNDVPLWESLRGSVSAFLTTQWRNGMLQGRKPSEAFFVRIGLGETMTQDDIDNGRVIMLIGVAPVKPAEFVIFRITQMPRGSDVAE